MKIQIRRSAFETNSSSTHTLVIIKNDVWERFNKGEILFNVYKKEWKRKEELFDQYTKWAKKKIDKGDGTMSFEDYVTDCGYVGKNTDWYSTFDVETKSALDGEFIAVSMYGGEW